MYKGPMDKAMEGGDGVNVGGGCRVGVSNGRKMGTTVTKQQ